MWTNIVAAVHFEDKICAEIESHINKFQGPHPVSMLFCYRARNAEGSMLKPEDLGAALEITAADGLVQQMPGPWTLPIFLIIAPPPL